MPPQIYIKKKKPVKSEEISTENHSSSRSYERVPLLEQLRLRPHGLGILRSLLFGRSDGVEVCAGVGQTVDRKEPSSKKPILP